MTTYLCHDIRIILDNSLWIYTCIHVSFHSICYSAHVWLHVGSPLLSPCIFPQMKMLTSLSHFSIAHASMSQSQYAVVIWVNACHERINGCVHLGPDLYAWIEQFQKLCHDGASCFLSYGASLHVVICWRSSNIHVPFQRPHLSIWIVHRIWGTAD